MLLLFALPLGYMVVVYLGSLAALLQPDNLAIIVRTVGMAAAVTVACALLAFPLAYYIARYASRAPAAGSIWPCCCRSGPATWCASTPGS